MTLFENRKDAAKKMSGALAGSNPQIPLLVAIPRGGVPLAEGIHKALGWRWGVWTAKKLVHPDTPEHTLGALAEGEDPFWDEAALERFSIQKEDIDLWEARQEVHTQRERYADRILDVQGKTAIVIDDGAATGCTASAVAQALRARGALHVWAALPVCNPEAKLLGFDKIVALYRPKNFSYIAAYYKDFPVVSDREIIHDIEQP